MRFQVLRVVRSATILGMAAGCGGGGGTTEPTGPTLLEITGGNQTGQVGIALPTRIVVRASNSSGAVAAVSLTLVAEGQGGGSVTPRTTSTGADGTAQFTWTLGPKVGTQTLRASTPGQTPLTATATAIATAGPPAAVLANSEILQFVVVGRGVSTLPSVTVTDAFGNPLSGIPVTFEVAQGASVLTGTTQTSNAQGLALLGGWTIGQNAESYTIRASIAGNISTLFEARGIPAAMTSFEGAGQTANAGTPVAIVPSVRATRDDGSPLPNVTVNFTVVSGGGSVTGTSATTAPDGTARPTRWVLGPAAGPNRLQAVTAGRNPVDFDATGVPGVAAAMVASGGTNATGFFGNYVLGGPQVTVTDANGNPVASVPVAFQLTGGGGQLTGSSVPTDFLGRASPTSWRLGASGTQSLAASLGTLGPIPFTLTGTDAPTVSTFKIELRYTPGTNPTPEQRAAFDAAVARWTQLILAGAPPYLIYEDAGCGNIIGETVDGLIIHVFLHPIDGAGNILGAAAPCILRDDGYLPAQGYMEFDTADLTFLQQQNQLGPVIIHEMAHVLGFGTIWNFNPGQGFPVNAFLLGRPGPDPTFNGAAARAAFFGSIAAGTSFFGTPVPVEGTPAGAGTAYSHWRESLFRNELMTGFLSTSGPNPLSPVTVQQFRDIGYTVNDALADPYSFQGFIQSFGAAGIPLREAQLPGDMIVINRRGREVGRVARYFR